VKFVLRISVLCAGLIVFFCAARADAACTGSATTWGCPAGASTADVQAVIDGADDGAIVTFAAGAYTWSSQANFSASKGVTLTCTTPGACDVSVTGGAVIGVSSFSGTNTHLYRISGFTFDQSSNGFVIWFGSGCSGCNGAFTQIRIDHDTFHLTEGGVAIFFGENTSIGNFYGVIDHNAVTSAGSVQLLTMIGAVNDTPPPSPFGTADNMFVEDNDITITTMTNAGDGCMDGWGGDSIVWRHNTSLNCLVTSHGVTHAGGPQSVELYGNSMRVDNGAVAQGVGDGYRLFHHQGSGEFIAFDNTFAAANGKNSEVLSMLHYRDYPNAIDNGATQCDGTQSNDGNRVPTAANQGYPCWRQPGRDFAGNLRPMYVWNNAWSDTKAQVPMATPDIGGTPDYYANHMKADREWYNAVSASAQTSPTTPFDGTKGMGFGTLAQRPITCTTNASESGGGVGYFATDQCAQGLLYRCSATNVWTPHYTPYPYPHPLVSGISPQTMDGGVGCYGVGMDAGVDGGGSGADAGGGSDAAPPGNDGSGPGPDGSGPSDASANADGGGGGGCGCMLGAPEDSAPSWGVWIVAPLLALRRRCISAKTAASSPLAPCRASRPRPRSRAPSEPE
jgi:hypothetical protein